MLTKTDLREIRKVVREEVEAEIQPLKEELQADLKMAQIRIQSDIRGLQDRTKNVEIEVRKMRKDLKTTTNFLDREGLGVKKRVERIEKRLKLSPLPTQL